MCANQFADSREPGVRLLAIAAFWLAWLGGLMLTAKAEAIRLRAEPTVIGSSVYYWRIGMAAHPLMRSDPLTPVEIRLASGQWLR